MKTNLMKITTRNVCKNLRNDSTLRQIQRRLYNEIKILNETDDKTGIISVKLRLYLNEDVRSVYNPY